MQDHHRRHHDAHAVVRRAVYPEAKVKADAQPLDFAASETPSPISWEPTLVERQNSGSGDSSAPSSAPTGTCTNTTDPGCKLPEAAYTTRNSIIIACSVVIPIVVAVGVLIFLHRRNNRRQAAEDAKDADRDLDFGMDPSVARRGKKGRKGGPEMTVTDLNGHKGHMQGMSIDLGNPYILPPEVHGSSESLHSMSRSLVDKHDPYRMVKTPSIRSGRFGEGDDARSESQRTLLSHTSPMSKIPSPLGQETASIQRKAVPHLSNPAENEKPANGGFDFGDNAFQPTHEHQRSIDTATANRLSNQDKSLPATPFDGGLTPPARGDSKSPYMPNNNAGPVDPYSFQEVVVPPSPEAHHDLPTVHEPEPEPDNAHNFPYPPPPEPEDDYKRQTLGLGLDMPGNRLSVMRPLPPDDPEEDPGTRANRIRSFYREYFSDNDAHGYNAGADYYEDYGDEYLADGTVFDPETGQFIVAQAPYAAPVTRRAMTPPPRGPPPKFRGGPRRPGHMSSGSSPGFGPRGRAFSTASGSRVPGGPRGRGPKRPLPPPAALKNLPTPSLLKEDAFGMSMDFAPPTNYADRAAGRPDSPFLGEKPYAPKVPIAGSPLLSSYNELAVMPSPHSLRKSGTFTALDFAPPPKFRDPESGSDAGSIRSGRSNFSQQSARNQQNIRAGAYRLSRLPKGVVGTKNDIMSDLKPKWNMGQ